MLILKSWLAPTFSFMDIPPSATALKLDVIYKFLCDRNCNFSLLAYLCANEDEIEKDMAWARDRTAVVHRWHALAMDSIDPGMAVERYGACVVELARRFADDTQSSFLGALTVNERRRWAEFQGWQIPPIVRDLGQEPSRRALCSKGATLHTLISGLGVKSVADSGCDRILTAFEMFATMGFL